MAERYKNTHETEIQNPLLKHTKRYSTSLTVREIHIKLIGNSDCGQDRVRRTRSNLMP